MILGAHHALRALAVLRGEVVDMRADRGRADEGDGHDVRVAAQRVDRALAAVDDVEHAGRHPRLQSELGEEHGSDRVLLRWLEHEGVAADDGHGKHPQRDHRRKIERRDAGAHTDRLAQRVGVDAARDVLRELAELQGADGTGVLHDLEAAKHIALGIRQGLALLGAQGLRNAAHVLANERLQLEHDARARRDRGVLPGLECRFRRGDGGLDLRIRGERYLREHLLGRRIDDVAPFAGLRFDEPAVEQHLDGGRLLGHYRGFGGHECSPCIDSSRAITRRWISLVPS